MSRSRHEEILTELLRDLASQDRRPQIGLLLPSGYPDIVTSGEIYEIKPRLTVRAVQQAVGQLSLYGVDLPGRALMIVGDASAGFTKFQSHCRALGINLIAYGEQEEAPITTGTNPAWASSFQLETWAPETWGQVFRAIGIGLITLLGISYLAEWLRQLMGL